MEERVKEGGEAVGDKKITRWRQSGRCIPNLSSHCPIGCVLFQHHGQLITFSTHSQERKREEGESKAIEEKKNVA